MNQSPRNDWARPRSMKKPGLSHTLDSKVSRFTVSLAPELAAGLDQWAEQSHYSNRSQALADLVRREMTRRRSRRAEEIMAGSITLFYREDRALLLLRVAEVCRTHVREVVSSLHVMLEHGFAMEVLVLQGRVDDLNDLQRQLTGLRGVEVGELVLTSAILPPLAQKEMPDVP